MNPCNTCNASHKNTVERIIRCGTCKVQPGGMPTKYKPAQSNREKKMNQPTTHTPGPFDKVRASAKKLGETADQMERLLNKTKSEKDRIRDAAPDLLEAIKALLNQFEQRGVLVNPQHPDRIAVEQARAAIAKATEK